MQNFTLHTHNNELRFDGRASAKEMITSAENFGFKTIGVSNHLIVNEKLSFNPGAEPMFLTDFTKAYEIYMKHIEILNDLKDKHKIDIKIGFEVDFFEDKTWRNNFEKMLKKLPVDYLIGSNHFLRTPKEEFIVNIYHLKKLETKPAEDELKEMTHNHLKASITAIKSGYFNFMAHLDYCTIFNLGTTEEFNIDKENIVQALIQTKHPFEINTSGYDRIGFPHPNYWMLKELINANIPTLLSDDAHDPDKLGRHFAKAEEVLKELNCKTRFNLATLTNKMIA